MIKFRKFSEIFKDFFPKTFIKFWFIRKFWLNLELNLFLENLSFSPFKWTYSFTYSFSWEKIYCDIRPQKSKSFRFLGKNKNNKKTHIKQNKRRQKFLCKTYLHTNTYIYGHIQEKPLHALGHATLLYYDKSTPYCREEQKNFMFIVCEWSLFKYACVGVYVCACMLLL